MRHSFHDTQTGAEVDEHTALDERGCMRDGFTMRTKLTMMDGMPVFDERVVLTNQQKSDAIDRRNKKLSDAWKNPTSVLPIKQEQQRTVAADRASYDKRITDAWQS